MIIEEQKIVTTKRKVCDYCGEGEDNGSSFPIEDVQSINGGTLFHLHEKCTFEAAVKYIINRDNL